MRSSHQKTDFDPSLVGLARHMHAIGDYRNAFGQLQGAWDTLALLGQLSGNVVEMSGTRTAFEDLTGRLLDHLAQETRDKVVADLRTKAQNAIDVLVRNLFERTADIGFLAADTDIREMLQDGAEDLEARRAIEARFRDYVAKYSVYSDIVLTGVDGAVRARLCPHPAATVEHPVVAEALSSQGAYVENYGPADFLEPGDQLVYAWRVESLDRRPLGVLILVFRLQDEMAGIFQKLLAPDDWTVLGCVTADGRVVAGSCAIQLPVGFRLGTSALDGRKPVLRLGGRQYLAVTCRSAGYQGYLGPGWTGLGLLPLEGAFAQDEAEVGVSPDDILLNEAMSQSEMFSEALRTVSRQAGTIQRDLNRSVWNGSVRQAASLADNAAFSKILLWEISNAGRHTQALFESSIGDLQRTVASALLQKCRSRANFAVDVMDRNLYERANDCRWWALNATFARVLVDPDGDGIARCAAVLHAINELYTVYSNLILFDAEGRVVAVSNASGTALPGQRIEAEWVSRTLSLRSGQHYAVSAFEATPLYGGEATLIYTAGIQHPQGGRPVGGIAVVFDAKPQFAAILTDSLPRDETGASLAGAYSLFVGKDGRVVASSDPRFPIGSRPPIAVEPAALRDNVDLARMEILDGQYVAIGAALSQGYREYKVSDGHSDDVVALCVVPLGPVQDGRAGGRPPSSETATLRRPSGASDSFEVATFHVGAYWLGVKAQDVVEAADFAPLKPPARHSKEGVLIGYKLHRGAPVPVLRLTRLIGIPDAEEGGDRQIVILSSRGREFGLAVDRLGPIHEVAQNELQPLRDLNTKAEIPALGVVAATDAAGLPAGMMVLLDVDKLGARLDGEMPLILEAAE